METGPSVPALSRAELERKKADHREFRARFDRQFGNIDTRTLDEQIERGGLNQSPFFARLKSRLALSAVIDACYVLDLLRGAVRGTPSAFWDLVRSQVITCWAPIELETDLEGKFELLASQLGVPIERVKLAWERDVAPLIHIASGHETPEVASAIKRLIARDPKDTGYPGLLITIGADAVLTKDKDLKEDGGVTTWTFGDAIRMIGTHDRGRIALQVQFHTASALLVAFAVGAGAAKEAAQGIDKLLRGVPEKVWLGIGLGIASLMLFDAPRRWVQDRLTDLRRQFGSYWEAFSEAAIQAWQFLGPVIEDVYRATSEAEVQTKVLAKRPKRFGRIPEPLRTRVLQSLGSCPQGLSLDEVLEAAFPRLHVCDTAVLRRQVYRLLVSHPGVARVARGRFALAHDPREGLKHV